MNMLSKLAYNLSGFVFHLGLKGQSALGTSSPGRYILVFFLTLKRVHPNLKSKYIWDSA